MCSETGSPSLLVVGERSAGVEALLEDLGSVEAFAELLAEEKRQVRV